MALHRKRIGPLALRLLAVVALLGCPQIGSAAGTWSVITLPQKAGEVSAPNALAVDAAGNLYVADSYFHDRIQKRDAQGNWSVIATEGDGLGQVDGPTALAVDAAGNLYVGESSYGGGRVQKRDAQGNWSVFATYGTALGQVHNLAALALDAAGDLYVAESFPGGRIQKRDAQGRWSVVATYGEAPGQVLFPFALSVDTAGNLYVVEVYDYCGDSGNGRIQKRDAQGNWSILATAGDALGQVGGPSGLAVDTGGNLYVADNGSRDGQLHYGRIQKRDAQGHWSVIATVGSALGQVRFVVHDGAVVASGLAVDTAGNLYVADYGNGRVQEYTPSGGP